MLDLLENIQILRAIKPAAPIAFQRFDLGEFGFPEAQNVLRHIQNIGGFADGAKGGRGFFFFQFRRFVGEKGDVGACHDVPRVRWLLFCAEVIASEAGTLRPALTTLYSQLVSTYWKH